MDTPAKPESKIEGYCVRCKEKREMTKAQQIDMPAKGGGRRPALKGICAACGEGMFKILPLERSAFEAAKAEEKSRTQRSFEEYNEAAYSTEKIKAFFVIIFGLVVLFVLGVVILAIIKWSFRIVFG